MSSSTSAARAEARRGLLLVAFAGVLWGTLGVAARALAERGVASAVVVCFWRLALATPALALAARLTIGRGGWSATRGDRLRLALNDALVAAYQVAYFAAIPRVGVGLATLVALCVAPVLVALAGALRGREPLGRPVVVALAAAVAGTACVVWAPGAPAGVPGSAASLGVLDARALDAGRLVGLGLALASAAGYAASVLLTRAVTARQHPLPATAVTFGVGALVLGPAAALTAPGAGPGAAAYALKAWWLLVYLGLVPSALGYVLFAAGVRRVKPTAAAVVEGARPPLGRGSSRPGGSTPASGTSAARPRRTGCSATRSSRPWPTCGAVRRRGPAVRRVGWQGAPARAALAPARGPA